MISTALPNWRRPWLLPFAPILKNVIDNKADVGVIRQHWCEYFNSIAAEFCISNHNNQAIRFVPQALLAPDNAYELFIGTTGGVPTRDNLHDFFNALVWLTYPVSKAALNLVHVDEIKRFQTCSHAAPSGATSHTSMRGKLRDRATIFDENAALVLTCDPSIASLLAAHEWRQALFKRRADFGVMWDVALFGHALIEKLINPYKAITAHVWVLNVEPAFFRYDRQEKDAVIDYLLSRQLNSGMLSQPPAHLPILGVPGWWEGQDETFYQDSAVFRPKKI